jgi:putative phage-type endonuclease
MLIHKFDQRTPEWFQVREGKITASPILSILGKDTLQKTKDAIDNLAMKLAIETVHGMIEDSYVSHDMQRGIDLEPFAFDKLKESLEVDFINLETVGFIEYNEHIGASPDGYIKRKKTVEIKCPNAENFFKLVICDKIDPKHIAQMQHQMFCAGVDGAIYYAYCIHNNQEFFYRKEIERSEDTTLLIKSRCEDVIGLKLKYIDKLKQNLQIK